MNASYRSHLEQTLAEIEAAGLYKRERVIATPQRSHVALAGNGAAPTAAPAPGREVLNFCANNYLGLADHPEIIRAAHAALDRWGYGLSSVRFICGTQEIHKELEARLTAFLGTEDTILYSSCFDANGGVFETLLSAEDAVISDELNHASIIDGIRLCKAQRFRYRNRDLADLEAKLREADAAKARFKLIVTDGVFSMDGYIAPLREICDLADRHGALVMVDDSHAVGFMGKHGRGTPEHCGVMGRIDIITGTLGKALGGASGGYVSARKPMIELLRQRSRPYLFSNTLAPVIAAASIAALDLLSRSTELRDKLEASTKFFRAGLEKAGLTLRPGTHPIVPVMLGDAALSQQFAARMLDKGIYVTGFFYPVVPQGAARIRTQVSAAHSQADLEFAIRAFGEVKAELGL
ncbi:glycine C-acetyltransferase [Opitutus sp. ER46]|uniref:glycine C-acetyltransferase n=1 Tax=Opitutus sp. ER46 TaxID=2161864 RepID=UPI000D312B49|nr:glycine C-acetyltransferase [Opitutus sp. ER46]PTX92650.1 glycine C-acetyltransferase [Opitutus sp. ER46]